jgi:hypothetical protein
MATTQLKRIRAEASLGCNFVYHVLAIARIGFNSLYAERYVHTIPAQTLQELQKYGSLIRFGAGTSGPLVDFVVALPVYLRLDSKAAVEDYYSTLLRAVRSGDGSEFMNAYGIALGHFEPWYGVEAEDFRAAQPHYDALASLGEAFRSCFDRYCEEVWPINRQQIAPVVERVNAYFESRNIIDDWEKLIGVEYKRSVFTAVLCSALANGPNANSFAYDGVVFHSATPWPKLAHLIVHEIGTHLLIEPFRELRDRGDIASGPLYMVYECLAKYWARQVLGATELAYGLDQYHEPILMPWLEEHAKHCRGAEIERVLENGAKWLEAQSC